MNRSRTADSTSIATYSRSSPSAAYAALCMAGDRECATGCPITAARRRPGSTAMRQELGVAVREVLAGLAGVGAVVRLVGRAGWPGGLSPGRTGPPVGLGRRAVWLPVVYRLGSA